MPTFPGDPHSAAEWEQQKPKLHELYIQKRHSLREVQKMMAKMTPAFRATENQYKKRFQKWSWEKFPKAPKPSTFKTRAQPRQHESTSSPAFDDRLGLPAAALALGEPTQTPQSGKEINAFEALIELQRIVDEVTFSDHICQDWGMLLSSPLGPAFSGVLSQYLSRVSSGIIYMPVFDVDTINGVGNGAVFTIAANMSVRRSDGSISFLTWYGQGHIGFQLLMVWDLGSTRPERPCRYLKTLQYSVSRGSDVRGTLTELIQLGHEKAGNMYPGFCTRPRVLVSAHSVGYQDRLPGILLWRLFQYLYTAETQGQLPLE